MKGCVYDPSDTKSEVRWCRPCRRWFHSCCAEGELELEIEGDDGQQYLLEKGDDMFSRLISRPVRRVSRKHEAPLSLERIQIHLIGEWKERGGRNLGDYEMIEGVKECELFGGELDMNWEEEIERCVRVMGGWEWMRCPSCLSWYI